MDQRTDATTDDPHYTAHDSGLIDGGALDLGNITRTAEKIAASYPRVEIVSRPAPLGSVLLGPARMDKTTFDGPSGLRVRLRAMAAAGCKRTPACAPSGDGRCFNCQAADFVAKKDAPEVRRKDAIIASLKTNIVALEARHDTDTALMEMAADGAGGGRAYAEFRLTHVVDITLDCVGALLQAQAQIEFQGAEIARLSDLVANAQTDLTIERSNPV